MKRFIQLKSETLRELNSRTARDAALKAASKGETQIVLIQDDKLFIYEGTRRPLNENEKNVFTEERKIKYKPVATKMHYEKLTRSCNLKKEDDMIYMRERLSLLGVTVQ